MAGGMGGGTLRTLSECPSYQKTESVYTVKEEIFIVYIFSFKSPFSNICEKICENICENIFHQRTGSRVIFETQIFISMFMTFLVPKK